MPGLAIALPKRGGNRLALKTSSSAKIGHVHTPKEVRPFVPTGMFSGGCNFVVCLSGPFGLSFWGIPICSLGGFDVAVFGHSMCPIFGIW